MSALDEKGRPTPLAATMMRAPMSRMDILTESELAHLLATSQLAKKYNIEIDRNSAYEMLNEKIKQAEGQEAQEKAKEEREALEREKSNRRQSSSTGRSSRQNPFVKVLSSPTVIRSVLGILNKMLK